MQSNSNYIILIFLFSILQVSSLFARDIATLNSRITDESGTLSSEFKSSLEQKLADFESKTSHQLVVYIISSLEGESLEEYSLAVSEKNKLGQKGKDNGVLLLIAKDDRKLRIEVGYGLEGSLTDVLCHRIIEREIKPSFKSGDFEGGVRKGIDSIIGGIGGTYSLPPPKDESYLGAGEMDGGGEDIPILVKVVLSFFILFVLGIFTYMATFTPFVGWFLYFFLFPFWSLFPIGLHGPGIGLSVFFIYAIGIGGYKLYLLLTPSGRMKMKEMGKTAILSGGGRSGGSRGGFSGGGGSFGGGGSSGSW